MIKARRRLLALMGVSVLGTGCAPMGVNPGALGRRLMTAMGLQKPEELYTSLVYGDLSRSGAWSLDYDFDKSTQAYRIFKSIADQGKIPQQIPMPTEAQVDEAAEQVRRIIAKHQGKTQLELDDTYELMQHSIPLLRMYLDVHALDEPPRQKAAKGKPTAVARAAAATSVSVAPDGTVTIPPGYLVHYDQKGYCLDAGLPAPGKGEILSLIPAQSLIPEKLLPLYRAMLDRAYEDPSYRGDMQRLMWTLRGAGDPYSMAARVDEKTLRQMEAAMPGGAKLFVDYHNGNVAAKQLLNKLGEKAKIRVNGQEINPADFVDPRRSQAAVDALFRGSTQAMSAPVTGAVPTDGREFQMLTPTVASHATGSGTLQPQIRIVNTGTAPYTINLRHYIAKPGRPAQQIAMYPTRSVANARYPQVPDNSQLDALDKLKKKIDAYLNADLARFLSNQVLKGVAKDGCMRDLAFRALGNSPAAQKLIEMMPILGSGLSLYEAVSGKSWVNGRDLNAFERVAAGLGVVPGAKLFNSVLKAGAYGVAEKVFAGLGFAANGNYPAEVRSWLSQNMPATMDAVDKTGAYVKTFNNPLDATVGLVDGRINENMMKSLVDLGNDPNWTPKQKELIRQAIRDSQGAQPSRY